MGGEEGNGQETIEKGVVLPHCIKRENNKLAGTTRRLTLTLDIGMPDTINLLRNKERIMQSIRVSLNILIL